MNMSCRVVMDQLAAALAGYSSHISCSDEHPDEMEAAAAAGSAAAGRRGWRGVGYVRVDGSHDSTERLAAVRRFKADPSVRVALLSITAAAVGEFGVQPGDAEPVWEPLCCVANAVELRLHCLPRMQRW
jgi:hypothetical protein